MIPNQIQVCSCVGLSIEKRQTRVSFFQFLDNLPLGFRTPSWVYRMKRGPKSKKTITKVILEINRLSTNMQE